MTPFSSESQLKKFGWNRGQGLGKRNEGINRAVSVAFKDDQKGVGAGHDFSSQWWDHVFNKTTSAITVETNDTGDVVILKNSKSTAQPSKKSLLYGSFVKSSTTIQQDAKDYSVEVTDEELFAACEGRTARKGARVEQPGKMHRTVKPMSITASDTSNAHSQILHEKKRKEKRRKHYDNELANESTIAADNIGDKANMKKLKQNKRKYQDIPTFNVP